MGPSLQPRRGGEHKILWMVFAAEIAIGRRARPNDSGVGA